MLLRITHDTRYDYAQPIDGAQHILHLRPLRTPLQQMMAHDLRVAPQADSRAEHLDVFGNHVDWVSIQHRHSHVSIHAESQVRTLAPSHAISTVSWEMARDGFLYHANAQYDAAVAYIFPSPHIGYNAAFVDYAKPSFPSHAPLLDAARDLMQRVHRDFVYQSGSTSIDTSPLDSLALRQGVCQDFTHVMLSCFRSLGLAARYVSGYLLTNPPPGMPRLIGADATHAWVQVYLPDLRYPPDFADDLSYSAREARTDRTVARMGAWYDLCPTNARDGWGSPGEDYVRVAVGRDFSDVSPVRGVIFGAGSHSLQVSVTVAPIDEGMPFKPA